MATKRDSSHLVDSTDDHDEPDAAAGYQPSPKRARNNNKKQQQQQQQQQEPATNVTYGQRCCFPGIDSNAYNSDEDLEFEDESDALAYLQSVRQEASGIPHLLVAPKSGPQLPPPRRHGTVNTTKEELDYDDDEPVDRSIYTDGQGDARGYYQDGAYTAAPDPTSENTHAVVDHEAADDNGAHEIAEAYFSSLRTHFQHLRTRLHTPPPAHLVPSKDHSPYVGPFGPSSRTFTIWTARLLTTDPHPLQLALMDKGSAFRLLRVLLGGKFLRSGVEVHERTSRWLWALLARLPDRGELDHVEVGHVRELGKRAAVLMHSLQQMALLREEVELGGHDDDAGEGVWVGEDEEVDGQSDDTVKKEDEGEEGEEDIPVKTIENSHNNESTAPPNIPSAYDSSPAKAEPEVKLEEPDEMEDGEINDDNESESVPMDMDNEEDMQAAKARLLASLEDAPSEDESNGPSPKEEDMQEEKFDPVRARMNMRATLNMILTVAGEFYGQRDLLEFRDPFRGI